MKQTIILLLITLSVAAFGQAKEGKRLSAYEAGEVREISTTVNKLVKALRTQDSLQIVFLRKWFEYNGVDLTRVSIHPDSLQVKSDSIKYILKPKKK